MLRRFRTGLVASGVLAVMALTVPLMGQPPPKGIELSALGVYRTNLFDGGGAEIAA